LTNMATKTLKRRPRKVRCLGCRAPIRVKGKGRVPSYCSQACKQEAYLKRRYRGPMEMLSQAIATVQVRDVIRQEVRACLIQAGLISPATPPPPKPKAKATLRVVKPDKN
jgi:hypothetical protein